MDCMFLHNRKHKTLSEGKKHRARRKFNRFYVCFLIRNCYKNNAHNRLHFLYAYLKSLWYVVNVFDIVQCTGVRFWYKPTLIQRWKYECCVVCSFREKHSSLMQYLGFNVQLRVDIVALVRVIVGPERTDYPNKIVFSFLLSFFIPSYFWGKCLERYFISTDQILIFIWNSIRVLYT